MKSEPSDRADDSPEFNIFLNRTVSSKLIHFSHISRHLYSPCLYIIYYFIPLISTAKKVEILDFRTVK